jgi:A-factor biosynthesis hotdog domain
MSDDGVIVVGDRFEEFLGNKGTIPASALLWQLRRADADEAPAVVVGQGLSGDQLARLQAPVEAGVPTPVAKQLTHKRDGKNVMVGLPRPEADGRYVADLVVDAHNEVLEDHLTGQHIPAIALLESARQLWTVVTEEFLLDEDTGPTRFVVISMGGRFHRYVFPLPTTLHYELVRREKGVVGEDFHVRVAVCQGDVIAAEIEAEYRVVPEKVSAKQERMAARQAVRAVLAEATGDPGANGGAGSNGGAGPDGSADG